MFWFFGCEACGVLAPKPEIVPAHPALEGKVLATGPPGKSPHLFIRDTHAVASVHKQCVRHWVNRNERRRADWPQFPHL